MTRRIAVLRPEPGNARTAAAIAAAGLTAIQLPLFAIRPLPWRPPDPAAHDALILTSANAVRQAGAALAALRDLPAYVVGAQTASAAHAAGLTVAAIGTQDAIELAAIAAAAGVRRALHLAGREYRPLPDDIVSATRIVYASEALPVTAAALATLAGSIALLHSTRAALRLAELIEPPARADIAIGAISAPAADAAGPGWRAVAVAAQPQDSALIAAARALAD